MAIGRIRALGGRVLRDLAGPDRFGEYESLLSEARHAGYRLISLAQFSGSRFEPEDRLMILRHDVDIADVDGNRRFFDIERRVGARSSFYFRLVTAPSHEALIAELLRAGFEVGYHFEEAATIGKERVVRSSRELVQHQPEIQRAFRANVAAFRAQWNPDVISAASHGDWMNRRLGVTNRELLSAETVASAGLQFEAYDTDLMARVNSYVSDVATPPSRWKADYGPLDAIRDGHRRIYVLTHDRRWHSARRAAVAADLGRLGETIRYALRGRLTRSASRRGERGNAA